MGNGDYERGLQDGRTQGGSSSCFVFIIAPIIFWLMIVRWGWGIPLAENLFKYESRTAEEWFDEADYWNVKYINFRNCVEDYDNFDILTQAQYGGVFYYCE